MQKRVHYFFRKETDFIKMRTKKQFIIPTERDMIL